jgi:hypothetical protein
MPRGETVHVFLDEILYSNNIDPSELRPIERILVMLEDSLESDEFFAWQDDFAEKHCGLFTEQGDLPLQCMKVFQEYVQAVEKRLLAKIRKSQPEFKFDNLIPELVAHKNDGEFQYSHVFEILNAAADFGEFRTLMVSYKEGQSVTFDFNMTKLTL